MINSKSEKLDFMIIKIKRLNNISFCIDLL